MTPERFETLADAYGADVARWPAVEREPAAVLMAADPAWAQAVLARAGDLDALLAGYQLPGGASGLADRIVAAAPKPRPRWVGWLLPAGMGVGLATACAAGVLLGAQLQALAPAGSASDTDALMTAVSDEDMGFYLDEDA